jgi:hypothetical protein
LNNHSFSKYQHQFLAKSFITRNFQSFVYQMSNQAVAQRKVTRSRTREHGSHRIVGSDSKDTSIKFHLSVSDHRFAVKNPTRYIPDVLGKKVTKSL